MKPRIKHSSLTDSIVEDIEAKIIEGSLRPNQRIIEEELCKDYGVSRSPVREALRTLESRGFVERQPRKGVTVTALSLKEMEDIYMIRARLESLATVLAIKNQRQTTIKKLKNLHQRMIELAENNDVNQYYKLNHKFHNTIIHASGNTRLINLLDSFNKQTMRYRRMVTQSPGWMEESLGVHGKLIEWFETRNLKQAERYTQKAILDRIRKQFSIDPFTITEENAE
jgi:DNA-binding GntR family transcriptional regulator